MNPLARVFKILPPRTFLPFAAASGLGWLLDMAVFTALVSWTGFSPFVANLVSGCVGMTFAFIVAHERIFRKNETALTRKIAFYIVYSLAAIIAASAAIGALQPLMLPFLNPAAAAVAAKIIVTPFTLALNFLVARLTSERLVLRGAFLRNWYRALKRLDDSRPRLFMAALFILGVALLVLRNADPFVFPILYGEDGPWTGKLLEKGVWETGLHARQGFPVLGSSILHFIGLGLNGLFFGKSLVYLPQIYACVSWAFMAGVALLPFALFRKRFHLLTRLSLWGFLLLMPMGGENNEVLGRILNLAYLFPVIALVVMIRALMKPEDLRLQAACLAVFFICMLTFPVTFGLVPVYAAFYALWLWRRQRGTRKAFLWGVPVAALLLMGGTFLLMPSDMFTFAGGAGGLEVKREAMIEFVLARMLLFPIIAPVYRLLNDTLVVELALLFAAAAAWLYWRLRACKLDDLLPVWCAWSGFAVYILGVAVQRRGLSAFLGHYGTSFPDRYYYGLNIMGMVAVLLLLDLAARRLGGRMKKLVLFGPALLAFLVLTHGAVIFTFIWPSARYHEEVNFPQAVAREACPDRAVLLEKRTRPGFVPVPTQPIAQMADDRYVWHINLPQDYFDATVKALKVDCGGTGKPARKG